MGAAYGKDIPEEVRGDPDIGLSDEAMRELEDLFQKNNVPGAYYPSVATILRLDLDKYTLSEAAQSEVARKLNVFLNTKRYQEKLVREGVIYEGFDYRQKPLEMTMNNLLPEISVSHDQLAMLKEVPVGELGIPGRYQTALQQADVHTLADVLGLSSEKLWEIDGLGPTGIEYIGTILQDAFVQSEIHEPKQTLSDLLFRNMPARRKRVEDLTT